MKGKATIAGSMILPKEWSAERIVVEVINPADVEDEISGYTISLKNVQQDLAGTMGKRFSVDIDDQFKKLLHPTKDELIGISSSSNINKVPDHLLKEIKAGNVIAFLGAGF